MADMYIDDTKRKKIVSFWLPVCLGFLHLWASALILAVTVFDRHNDTIDSMFETCGWGIVIVGGLLISNQGLELLALFIRSKISGLGQVIEKTTTEKTIVTPSAPVEQIANVDIKAENVNVS